MSWAATLGSCGAVYWFKTIYNKPNKKRKTGEFDLGRSTFVYGKKNKWPKTLLVFWVTFFFSTQFCLSHCRIPDLYVCELVAHARGHVMALSTRREKRAAPDRPVRASGRTTERVQSFYIKRRDWRFYTCVCVQSTQGICLFVLSDEICV